MSDAVKFMLEDLKEKYEPIPTRRAFERLYDDPDWGHMFAVLHKRLNDHFSDINGRATSTQHYWAESSRDLLNLIEDIEHDIYQLKRAGIEVELVDQYQDALDRCRPWLSPSGGSAVPNDFVKIELLEYEVAFTKEAGTVRLQKSVATAPLKMVGSGSYAHVYSYVDPDYGVRFAIKRAKKDLLESDLVRFKQEFDVLKKLSFPYVVEAYFYDAEKNQYRMEFCDSTLRDYVLRSNASLSFSARKRIALQFLYGMNYIHRKGYLHRDVSLQNILLKTYDSGAVLVKLSDFGLVKDRGNALTRTHSEMRGTIRDPLLSDFKNYSAVHEIYSIGHVLAYIFTGKESIPESTDEVGRIVHKCVILDLARRYQTVMDVITDIETLEAPAFGTTA